jgi:hypothetical protein
MGIYR